MFKLKILEQYRDFVFENKDRKPRIELLPISVRQNSFQYVGGQILDGILYSIVNSSERMLAYDIKKGDIDFLGAFDRTDFKWSGGCIFEGRLYMFPRTSKGLLVYHTKSGTFEEIDCGFAYDGEHHYGGVCTSDGIVYQPPRGTDHILKWDLKRRTCEKIKINGGVPCRYCGSVVHPDGSIWFIPEKDLPVIKMDVATERMTEIEAPTSCLAFDPTVAADGNIYGFSSGCGIVKIDTLENRASLLFAEHYIGAYGTKAGINGKLYSFPGYTAEILEFDPFMGELKLCGTLDGDFSVRYAGGAVDKNGDIYALPVHEDRFLRIGFPDFCGSIPEDVYNAFFMDCY